MKNERRKKWNTGKDKDGIKNRMQLLGKWRMASITVFKVIISFPSG